MREINILTKMSLFLAKIKNNHFTISEFTNTLREKSFGIILLVLALPNALLLTIVPGLSSIFGFALILVSIQMIVNLEKIWLPRVIGKQKFSKKYLKSIFSTSAPYVTKISKILKIRFLFIVNICSERIIGTICLIHGIIITLPIPLGNFLCGIAITIFALGIIAKDGLFILIGFVISLLIFYFIYSSMHITLDILWRFFYI